MKSFMKSLGMATLLLLVTGVSHAESLKPQLFENQWEAEQALTVSTQWVIFSHHKAGGQWVKESLEELGVENLDERKWLYVADISGMPSIITNLFALPKMRDYAFPIALVKEEKQAAGWARKDEQVTVYQLNHLVVKQTQFFADKESLKQFLASVSQ